jgi:hypothetical protein
MIGSSLGGGIVSVNANINNGSTNASYNTNLSTLNTIGRILKRKVQEFQTDKLDTQLHGNTNSQMRDKYREKEREKQK